MSAQETSRTGVSAATAAGPAGREGTREAGGPLGTSTPGSGGMKDISAAGSSVQAGAGVGMDSASGLDAASYGAGVGDARTSGQQTDYPDLPADGPPNNDDMSLSTPQPPPQPLPHARTYSPSHPPTSDEIDAIIAAATANAPPAPIPDFPDQINRSVTPLMTNLLPAAVGMDGRVNLFVGNLPYRVRWQDLKDLFRKAGTVLRSDVSLGPDNRSRGYGTVLMGSREDAARAIDRFNGFNWQSRTLEVRPDRLPPEYEAQMHQHQGHAHGVPIHIGGRGGPIGPSGPMFGHSMPMGGPGFPGPHRFGSGAGHPIIGNMSAPNMGIPHHMASMSGTTSSPNPGPASLAPSAPGPGFANLAASPLAGSLTAGTAPSPLPALPADLDPGRRASSAALSQASDHITRSTTPFGSSSRPASSAGTGNTSPPGSRAPAPGSLGPLPPSMFAGVKAVVSPEEPDPSAGVAQGRRDSKHGLASHLPQMEGLAHQGPDLGPPATLHDRVVFVSNLPLFMQWQELKDLLRPAGIIIRADVAIGPDGRPRGFGTALFATEQDAARAVAMYNDKDIQGQRIRVALERESLHDPTGRPTPEHNVALSLQATPPDPAARERAPSDGSEGSRAAALQQGLRNGLTPLEPVSPDSAEPTPLTASSTGPIFHPGWVLPTPITQTPRRLPNGISVGGDGYRAHHHPSHITMPPYSDTFNPLSPLQTRGLPPMTPSMPGFIFNPAAGYPETPGAGSGGPSGMPGHPPFFSPSGPFSPGIPLTSPAAFHFPPYLNPAPGAPVNRFPGSGSAQLGTPTTQVFQQNPFGYPGTYDPNFGGKQVDEAAESVTGTEEYFPPIGTRLGQPTTASALNAGDREAVDELEGLTRGLHVGTGARGPENRPEEEEEDEDRDGAQTPTGVGRGRASLDEKRAGLSVPSLTGGERRSSLI